MKKIVLGLVLIFSFSQVVYSEEIEKCADDKTRMYWGMWALGFLKEVGIWEEYYKNSKDKYERKAIKLTIKEKKYYLKLYKNASKKIWVRNCMNSLNSK